MIILLLDMDGVLLEPHGYHQALIDSVKLIGHALGYPRAVLTAQEIAAFEAAGITSEWDSAAACTALMLIHRWNADEDVTLPQRISPPYKPISGLKRPNFGAFARSLNQTTAHNLRPAQRVEKAIREKFDHLAPHQIEIIRDLLRNATTAEGSITHRTFQELVLGSDVYVRIYPYPATLNSPSYLQRYDQPNLSLREQALLRQWLAPKDQSGAILTLRPSQPPGKEVFSTPEAEMGAQLVGLDEVPIAGYGGLIWLANMHNLNPRSLGKPSPVHALVALQLAVGEALVRALNASAQLALDEQKDERWKILHRAQVIVIEDSANGMSSALRAKELLAKHAIHIDVNLFGVTANHTKQSSMKAVGARIIPTLPEALRAARILE